MENNYSSKDRTPAFDRALSLPHFDEEATLLSARPVVPLNQVKVETGSRRRVFFGLSILAAILVGAIGATLVIQRGQTWPTAAEAEVSQPTASSTGAAGGSTAEPVEARMAVAREPAAEPKTRGALNVRDSQVKERQTVAVSESPKRPTASPSSAKPARTDYETTEDVESDEREVRRAERRDARRDARRQHREQLERGDDILRIREIFEGSPRP
jgi:hypothetical protein